MTGRTLKGLALATTALAALSATAGPALAADPIKLQLGGYMEQWVGWADQDGDFETAGGTNYRSWDQQSDSEVHFTGATKLDNGISISVLIELDTDGDGSIGNFLDEAFLEASSEKWGTIQMGRVPHLSKQVKILAPDVGIENTDGDYGNWIVAPNNFVDVSATFFDGGGNPTVHKLTYMTPSLWGLQVGFDVVPENGGGAEHPVTLPDQASGDNASWSGVVHYERQMGELFMAVQGGYSHMSRGTATNGQTAIEGGLALGWGGFTVAGGYIRMLEDNYANANSNDGYAFDIGGSYATGPYAVSVTWLHSETEGALATAGQDEKDSIMLSGAYNLGPGVDLKASVFHVDYEDETTANVNNNEGWGVVGGVVLTF